MWGIYIYLNLEINEMHYGQMEMTEVDCGLKEMRWNNREVDNGARDR